MRRRLVWAISAVALLAIVSYLGLYATARRDCYIWPNGDTALAEILLDCELEAPLGVVIIGCRAGPIPALFPIESALACRYRDQHTADYLSWDPESSNALHRLANTHNVCRTHESMSDECARAHVAGIDWLLGAALHIDSVAYGTQTALHIAIWDLNEELFSELLARGADPHFRPPADDAKTPIELLRWKIEEVDHQEFPDVVAQWKRMLELATSGRSPAALQGAAANVAQRVPIDLW